MFSDHVGVRNSLDSDAAKYGTPYPPKPTSAKISMDYTDTLFVSTSSLNGSSDLDDTVARYIRMALMTVIFSLSLN